MYKKLRRLSEIIICLIILLILIPLILIISIAIKIETDGPIIFLSKRTGIDDKIFLMPKFRTMFNRTKLSESNKIKNPEKKITKVGRILRKYSLDEIPQFLTVIQGKMSIVGPRPALLQQKELIKKRKKLGINRLKPGITGYAQINSRDKISLNKKIELDSIYLKNKNLLLDIKIFFKTFTVVINQKGILH